MFSKQLCKVIAPQLFNLKWKGKVEGLFVWGWDQNEYMHLPRLTLLQPGFVTRYAVTMIKLSLPSWNRVKPLLPKGPFNNYVDKMRRGGGQKMSGFCPRSGYKNCPCRGGSQKMAKFCPRNCWMAPKVISPQPKGLLHGPYNERYCNSFQTTINEAGLCYTFNNYNLGTKGRVAKVVEFQERHLTTL